MMVERMECIASQRLLGLKLALWYSEMKRNIERFEHAAEGIEAR